MPFNPFVAGSLTGGKVTALVAFVHLFVDRKGNLSGVCIRPANGRAMECLSMHFRPSSLRLPNGRKVVMAGTSSPPTLEDALRITPSLPSNVQGTVPFSAGRARGQEVKEGLKTDCTARYHPSFTVSSFRQAQTRVCPPCRVCPWRRILSRTHHQRAHCDRQSHTGAISLIR